MKIYSRRIRCDAMALNKLTVSPFYHHITVCLCIQYNIVHLNGLSIVDVRIVRIFLLAGRHTETALPHGHHSMHMGEMLNWTVCYLSTITPMKPFQCRCHLYTLCALFKVCNVYTNGLPEYFSSIRVSLDLSKKKTIRTHTAHSTTLTRYSTEKCSMQKAHTRTGYH